MNTTSLFHLLAVVAGTSLMSPSRLPAQVQASHDSLRVLPPYPDARRSQGVLRDHLRQASQPAFDRRTKRYESLKTVDEITAYQQDLRARFIEELGGFPARTPLNARITATRTGEGYRVENVILESQPGFHVTANLYLPVGPPPHPVVLMPCGHMATGKAGYQQAAVTLVRSGIAVFCFDPVGQGERSQVLHEGTAGGEPRPGTPVFEPTREHTITSVAPILLGRNLATYMIWDGIRSIDYLETRPDLDAKRLGCVGNSGGGMMTSYLMALDERIASAALGCFMTTSRLKNESPGPGDAEQNVHAQYVHGIDHPDFLILQAPRPALILAATQDYVPIAGAWDAFRQAKRIYTRLGFAERVDLIETDAPHGFSVQLREGAARWMRRWLLAKDDVVVEQPSRLFTNGELQCTPEGQVLRLPGARSVFDLNREEAARLAAVRKTPWSARSDDERRAIVRQTAGIRPMAGLSGARIEEHGTIRRPGYRIHKLRIMPEDGVPLPMLRFVPETPNGSVSLYLHGQGKHVDATPGGPIERLVSDGIEVLAVDLRGFGETAMHPWRYGPAEVTGNNGAETAVAYMLGRPLLGMRAEDVLLVSKLFPTDGAQRRRLGLIALDDATLPALHAAALEPELFSTVRLVRAITSWEHVIEATVPRRQLESVVHGALRVYDLPELVALAGNVVFVEPVDATGRRIDP